MYIYNLYIFMDECVCVCVYVCVCVGVYVSVCVGVYVSVCVCRYICMYVYISSLHACFRYAGRKWPTPALTCTSLLIV